MKLSRSEVEIGNLTRHKLVIQSDPMSKQELYRFLEELSNSYGVITCGPVLPTEISLSYGVDSWTLTAYGDVMRELDQ